MHRHYILKQGILNNHIIVKHHKLHNLEFWRKFSVNLPHNLLVNHLMNGLALVHCRLAIVVIATALAEGLVLVDDEEGSEVGEAVAQQEHLLDALDPAEEIFLDAWVAAHCVSGDVMDT